MCVDGEEERVECAFVWCVRVCLFVSVCGVCVCVARLGTRNNPPCAGSKRLRVYWQHAHMCLITTSPSFL